ncbi:RDD family protein [Microbacterium sp. JZ31]|uniref:RDD family protein n=1 Tax=Microbacterium sp. JZ31 TaxID=1906274 RepID=UPI0019331C95|nr:RDD family protein [Microbacterium sp. JZ31]
MGSGEGSDGVIWEIDEEKRTIEGVDASGRPDPAYAAALGLVRAPFGRRALAAVCDLASWLVLQLPLLLGAVPLLLKLATGSISAYGFLNHPDFVLAVVMASATAALTLALGIVQLVLHGRKGLTIGKAVAGIRTVNVRTLERPGAGPVLLRFLILVGAAILPLGLAIFFLSPVLDPDGRGRGWHDKATRVWLVDVRKGLNPYDEKRMRVARKVVKAEPAPERAPLPSLATPVDPSAQPAYRPGGRVSAGVIGVARPHDPRERPVVGLAEIAPAPVVVAGESGRPVLGGYRLRGDTDPTPDAPSAEAERGQSAPRPAAAPPTTPFAAESVAAPPAAVTPPAAPAVPPQVVLTGSDARAAEPIPPAARFMLRLDTGEDLLVSAPVVLGRRPDASEIPGGAHPVALEDDSRSLSKTHLLVRPAEGGLEVVDLGSTNGSALIRGGVEHPMTAGVPLTAADSDTIRFGDRTAVVTRL